MTTSTTTKKLSVALALATGLTLALSACGGGADPPQGGKGGAEDGKSAASADDNRGGIGGAEGESPEPSAVYDFDQAKSLTNEAETPYTVTDQQVTIELSDELAAAMPQGAAVAVQKYDVTIKSFPTGLCRLDAAVTYADGGLESVKEADPGDSSIDSDGEAVMEAVTSDSRDYEPEVVDAVPGDDEVDEGSYITTDFQTITVVNECSEGSERTDDEFTGLGFPFLDRSDGDGDPFASTEIFVVSGGQDSASGATAVIYGDTEADLSANGSWMPQSED